MGWAAAGMPSHAKGRARGKNWADSRGDRRSTPSGWAGLSAMPGPRPSRDVRRQHRPEGRAVACPPVGQAAWRAIRNACDPFVYELVHGLAHLRAKDQLGQGDDDGRYADPDFRGR